MLFWDKNTLAYSTLSWGMQKYECCEYATIGLYYKRVTIVIDAPSGVSK
jgi:hypothetical protein